MLSLAKPGERRLAYGFWRYRDADGEADGKTGLVMLERARESGIDHLDTADIYGEGGAERLLGALRRRAPALFKGVTLATKCGIERGTPYNSSAAYLTAACEASLKRLGVERIDLFYIHRPDLLTHPADLAATLDGLIAAGKIAAFGASNFTTAQVSALQRFLKAPIAAHQFEFSAAHVDALTDGTLDQAMERSIAVAAWSPLAGGRIFSSDQPSSRRLREAVTKLAREKAVPPAAVALAFVQQHPAGVTPILGTKRPDRLAECLAANDVTLSRAEWYAILVACRGERMP